MKNTLQYKPRVTVYAIAWAVLLWFAPALQGQGPVSFTAKISSPELVQGNQFELTFELKNAEGTRFRAPDFPPFRLVNGPDFISGTTFINGKVSTQLRWTYVLDATQTGTFTLGPARVLVAGKEMLTKALSIRVLPPKSGNGKQNVNIPPGAKDDLFISASLNQSTAYPGQQLTYQIKLYTLVSIEGADLIGLPDFKGFFYKEKRRFNTEIQYVTLRGKKYAVKNIYEAALYPQEKGTLEIGPARIRAGIEQIGSLGMFMGPRPVLLQTQTVSVAVKSLPDPVPANFCGGVGAYSWEIQSDKDTITTDEVLTVRAAVRGDGDARRFALPKLELPEGLEAFEPKTIADEAYENGELLIHRNDVEYVIQPKVPGTYTIKPSFVCYDPESNQYKTVTSDSSVSIFVIAGKNAVTQQMISDSLERQAPILEVQPGFWKKMGNWPFVFGFLALAILGILYWIVRRRQQERRPKPTSTLTETPVPDRQDLIKSSKTQFTEAHRHLRSANPRAFYDALFKGLTGYLTVKLALSPAQLTHSAVQTKLIQLQIPATEIQQLLAVWQSCEQALFSGQADATAMESLLRQAEACIHLLDKALKH